MDGSVSRLVQFLTIFDPLNSQLGIGDTVLDNREGNGARQALKNPDACVISVIVGIVDSVSVEG